jgi:hypothetical protein
MQNNMVYYFIDFESNEEAKDAIAKLTGKKFSSICREK